MLFFVGLETIPSFGIFTYGIIAADYFLYVVSFVVLFYSFYFFIKKEHLNKKRIKSLIIFGLLFVLFINIPIAFIYVLFLAKEILNLNGNAFLLDFAKYYMSFLETNFLFAMSGSLMKIALLWYDNIMKQKEIEKQLVLGELALLKSQINPNFLFNTLTNIKSLIEQKPDKAIYSIENLSEIMSYMLYETKAEKVLLDDEIDNINNFLNLQRVWNDPDSISFDVTGETNGITVPPMIFMPFIEYAFAYGDFKSLTQKISITIETTDNKLSFELTYYANESNEEFMSDFNLQSIKRRFDLLFGKNKYALEEQSKNNKYFVKLEIHL